MYLWSGVGFFRMHQNLSFLFILITHPLFPSFLPNLFIYIGGWICDLTIDGAESYPGPHFWGDIESEVKIHYGSEFDTKVQKELDKLRDDIRKSLKIEKPKPIPIEAVIPFLSGGGQNLLKDLVVDIVTKFSKDTCKRWISHENPFSDFIFTAPPLSSLQGKTSSMRTHFLHSRP
jgi:hypothetical protein